VKSLFLSALVHLAIFNIFVFVFPIIPPSHKPQFTFLGSILSEQDTVDISQQKKLPPKDFQLNDYITKPENANNRPFPNSHLTKAPFIEPNSDIEQKRTIKSTFLPVKDTQQLLNAQDLEDLGIKLKIEPYQPLRFQTR